MKSMNSFIGDELAVKVKYLSMALNRANKIIEQLEEENQRLNNLLVELSSEEHKLESQCLSNCHL